jgi:G:T/U-mismatch repair DNA glycosylase
MAARSNSTRNPFARFALADKKHVRAASPTDAGERICKRIKLEPAAGAIAVKAETPELVAKAGIAAKQETKQTTGPGQRIAQGEKLYSCTSFEPVVHSTVKPHTLLLGTLPSISSHAHNQYYGNQSNAFWWIAGDALGFRRGGPNQDKTWPSQWPGKPQRQIVDHLLHPNSEVLTYQDQVRRLTGAGFVIWDVLRKAEVKNSDDGSINLKNSVSNDIKKLILENPSIQKIVFASGGKSASLFRGHHKEWLKQSKRRFTLGNNAATRKEFSKLISADPPSDPSGPLIELVVVHSVSPAHARATYEQKRRSWFEHVYRDVLVAGAAAAATTAAAAGE